MATRLGRFSIGGAPRRPLIQMLPGDKTVGLVRVVEEGEGSWIVEVDRKARLVGRVTKQIDGVTYHCSVNAAGVADLAFVRGMIQPCSTLRASP